MYRYIHIYIYQIPGPTVTPRHGWTCVGAAAACTDAGELPDSGGRVCVYNTYIYIYVHILYHEYS